MDEGQRERGSNESRERERETKECMRSKDPFARKIGRQEGESEKNDTRREGRENVQCSKCHAWGCSCYVSVNFLTDRVPARLFVSIEQLIAADREKGATRVIQTREQEQEEVFEQSVSATNDSNSAGGGSQSLCTEDGKFNSQVQHTSEMIEERTRRSSSSSINEIKGKRSDFRTLEQ